MFFKFLIVLLLIKIALSDHFRGGVMMWRLSAKNNSTAIVDFTIKLAWRRDFGSTTFCDFTTINSNSVFLTGGVASSSLVVTPGTTNFPGVKCTDFSTTENWSYGEITIPITYSSSYFSSDLIVYYSSCCWILTNPSSPTDLGLQNGGGSSWNMSSIINLKTQLHTNKVNTAPIISMPPIIKVPLGCPRLIKIPVVDIDGDFIKCRWSTGNECGGDTINGCSNSYSSIIIYSNCTIKFNLASGAKNSYYAIKIHVEDFATLTSSPLSSLALEFLVETYATTDCSFIVPTFIGPTKPDQTCVPIPILSKYADTIVVDTNNINNVIKEIVTVSPLGMIKSGLYVYQNSKTAKYINITWTPVDTRIEIVCFIASTTAYITSDPLCIYLAAGYSNPEFFKNTAFPVGIIYSDQTFWSINITKGSKITINRKYISFYEKDTRVLAYQVNAANQSYVTLGDGLIIFSTGIFLIDRKSYYITIESDIIQSTLGCQLSNNEIVDTEFWTFTVKDCRTCNSDHGTCVGKDECRCDENWSGTDCDVPLCKYDCYDRGKCIDANLCECNYGFSGNLCDNITCLGVNNCSNHGICVDIDKCACFESWSGLNCSRSICRYNCNDNGECIDINKCECNMGYTGQFCDQVTCYGSNNCSKHGICIGIDTCICYEGWSGLNCDKALCKYNCNDNGQCIDLNKCQCEYGYGGQFCDQFTCVGLNGCSNHGFCTDIDQCICFKNWSGLNCNQPLCKFDCNGNGQCVDVNKCICNLGYIGQFCDQITCTGMNNCTNNGNCVGVDDCVCYENWSGPSCNIPLCKYNCNDNGKCTGVNNCSCYNGFSGDYCQTFSCVGVNSCSNQGFCIGIDKCRCETEWTSADCSKPIKSQLNPTCPNKPFSFNILGIILIVIIFIQVIIIIFIIYCFCHNSAKSK
jgi:hypothetical protein